MDPHAPLSLSLNWSFLNHEKDEIFLTKFEAPALNWIIAFEVGFTSVLSSKKFGDAVQTSRTAVNHGRLNINDFRKGRRHFE